MRRASPPRIAALLLLATLAAPARATAAGATQQARAHFNLASAHVERHEYDEALRELEAAYRLKPAPSFLYNLGVVARLAGRHQAAVDALQRYLATQPPRADRVAAERLVADEQKALADERERAVAAARAAPAPAVAAGAAAPLVAAAAPAPPREKRSRKKLWIALGVVGGVVVVAGAVTAAVVLTQPHDGDLPRGYHDLGGLSLSLGR